VQNFSTALLVVAVALMNPSGHVLLQRRRLAAVHGGLWEFPGGKLEPGETPELAAVRELSEELGIEIDQDSLRPVSFSSGTTGAGQDRRPIVILFYACEAWSGTPEARDADAIGWYSPGSVSELAMPPLDYPLAEALLKSFS